MTDLPTPTPRELALLKVLWEHGALSVREVFHHLEVERALAYNTVQTLLRIMEDKGLVTHHVEGRTFVYTPAFSRDESARRFLDGVFDGAADELVQSLLRSERIRPEELDRLRTMIDAARRQRGKREGR